MDKDIQGFFQDVGNASRVGQDMEDCLRNPVILTKIMQNLSTAELLELSFVNKLWKSEARNVMRKRGQFTAYVKAHDLDGCHPRENVEDFILDLKRMNPVPFSGINIDIYFEPGFGPWPISPLDPLQGVAFDQTGFLKTLSVQFRGSWMINLASPGFLLAKKALQDCSKVLEELELYIAYGRQDFIEKVLQDFTFPKLKVLKLRETYCRSGEAVQENYMRALLSRTPNLKALHCNWSINLMLRVLQGSSALPVYGSMVDAPFLQISEDVIGGIKLESIRLVYTGLQFDFDRFNRITPILLRTSCTTTLRCLAIDALLAIPLMCYGIRLENVKILSMNINFARLEFLEPRVLGIVKNFDFTRIFPNLNTVNITAFSYSSQYSPNHVSRIIEQANAVLRDPMPDRAVNVKVLFLNQRNLSSLAVQLFAEMFPSTENLYIRAEEIVPFESVWKKWLDLKELKVGGNMLPTIGNLDSVFCGIFSEEVAELRRKGEEYLKRVNIVPVMPAVTCLKSLRVLLLNHKDPHYFPFDGNAAFVFSKVTALVAFARSPTLAVTLNISPYSSYAARQVMDHLEPYVSVTSHHFEGDELKWYD